MSQQQPPNTIVVASRDDAESSSSADETTPLQTGMAAPPANYLASADRDSNGSSGSGGVSVVPAPSGGSPVASPSPDVAASPSTPDEETSGKDVEPVLDAADRAALDPQGPSVPAGQEADGAGVPSLAGSDAEGQRLMDHENPSLKQVVGLESPPASSGPAKPDTIEAGTAGMTHEQLLAIAARFKPVVWLHSQERYLPTTISMYLQRVRLGYDADWAPGRNADPSTYVWLKDAPSEDDLTDEGLFTLLLDYKTKSGDKRLANLTKDNVIKRAFHMQLKEDQHHTGYVSLTSPPLLPNRMPLLAACPPCAPCSLSFFACMSLQICGCSLSLSLSFPCPLPRVHSVSSFAEINSVPFYSRVRKYADHWEILYITMYAYNGPYNVCGCKCEPHSADVEHVTVRTNADATRLEWCYFGAHGRGWWRTLLPLAAAVAVAAAAAPAAGSAGRSHISRLGSAAASVCV